MYEREAEKDRDRLSNVSVASIISYNGHVVGYAWEATYDVN